jgi:hypothetical protein
MADTVGFAMRRFMLIPVAVLALVSPAVAKSPTGTCFGFRSDVKVAAAPGTSCKLATSAATRVLTFMQNNEDWPVHTRGCDAHRCVRFRLVVVRDYSGRYERGRFAFVMTLEGPPARPAGS